LSGKSFGLKAMSLLSVFQTASLGLKNWFKGTEPTVFLIAPGKRRDFCSGCSFPWPLQPLRSSSQNPKQ
jgi:hypothetical protein